MTRKFLTNLWGHISRWKFWSHISGPKWFFCFRGRTADFIFFFLFGMVMLSIAALFVNIIFLGNALNLMFVYLWARRNPFIRMTFFGVINFQVWKLRNLFLNKFFNMLDLGTILAVRPGRIFPRFGFANPSRRFGYYLWPRLLLPGRCISKYWRRFSHSNHAQYFKTYFWSGSGGVNNRKWSGSRTRWIRLGRR